MIMSNENLPSGLAINGEVIYGNGIPSPSLKIVPFKTGSDEDIAAMLEAHYNGEINIGDYWEIGDTRKVHINEWNSGATDHLEIDTTMVILGFNHDDLTTAINNKTKAAVTIGFREVVASPDGGNEYEYYWGESYTPVNDNDNYSGSGLRNYLNNDLIEAMPSSFSSMIKEVNKKNLEYHTKSDGAPLITKDKIWLMSYPEVFGNTSYKDYLNGKTECDYSKDVGDLWMEVTGTLEDVEGAQYEYMKTKSNRQKYMNRNGEQGPIASDYWLRSPSSLYGNGFGYVWCTCDGNGEPYRNDGNGTIGLAPAFCL